MSKRAKKSADRFPEPWKGYWDSNHIDKHRLGISDIKWASMQNKGPAKYMRGDIVKFKAGGIGIIHEVTQPQDGWPASYSARKVPGHPFHAKGKAAWHYEGDIERLVNPSAIRSMEILT
jgi:hypothetical protein